MKIIRRLPLDRYVTNGDKHKPIIGDIITWRKYDLDSRCWRDYKQAPFGTQDYEEMADEFNEYYTKKIEMIYRQG